MNKKLRLATLILLLCSSMMVFNACSTSTNKNSNTSTSSSSGSSASAAAGSDQSGDSVKAGGAFVTTRDLSSNTDTLQCDLKIPVVNGMSNTMIQDTINSLLSNNASSFKTDAEQKAKNASDPSNSSSSQFTKYQINSSFKVQYNKNNLLSITINNYQFEDGASSESQYGYTFDLTTGRQLQLTDLFDSSFDYKTIVNNTVLNTMRESAANYLPNAVSSFKTIAVNQPFYLQDGNLIIFYNENVIAPAASGIPEFKIPFSKLQFNSSFNLNKSV